ncbi:hypothetical protein THAR02_01901 [Trichoderma harzianum]|uniref:Uncharacterized protein n=1 Tax=Trichoderma harzianum TaxID=5544 RepID=A0A0G0ANE6_TRIHA|nr:hypothetical protein THAR02_01901 [Trichoderma harzianum]
MTLTQYIFTAFSFLRPWSSSDEPPAAIPRIYRYIVDTWIRRPVAPLISVTLLAALTLRLVRMAYFLPPKVSDAALKQHGAASAPQVPPPSAPEEQQHTTTGPQQHTLTGAQQDSLTRAQTERRRSISLGGWVKNMFPSQRPERGGTSREQGYWERMDKQGQTRPRRRMTDSQYSVGDVSVDSSHITRWNVPKDVSRDESLGLPEQPLSVVPATSKPSSPPKDNLPDRSWSWSPHNGSEEQISVTKVGGVLQSNYDQSNDARRSSLSIQTGTAAEGKQPLKQDLLRRARSKARRLERRSLRESGDYLGVQGVNPHTGELDIVSPTVSSAESSADHHETPRRILRTWHNVLKVHKSRDSPSRDGTIEDEDHRIARSLRGKKKGFLEKGSNLGDSGSQMSSSPTTPSEDKSFLDMEAERDETKSCTEASKAALSANQPTQSIPAFGQGFKRRFSLPGMMSMAPSSPHLHPSMFREPPRLTRREGSPLQAMPMPRSTEIRIRSRDMRKRWDDHLRQSRMKSQASTGRLQRDSVTMRRPAGSRHRHRRLTKMAIERDMLELKEGVAKVDKQRLEHPRHSHNQPVTEHEQTSNILREIRYQAPEIVASASIPTITITGYNHQTFHSAFLPDGSMNPDFLLPLSPTQRDESIYSALAVTSFENSLGGFHSDPSMNSKQSPTSSAEAEMGGEPQAGTTSLELEVHKMQLAEDHWQDRRTAKATMLVPEDDSLRKSTFTQGRMSQAVSQGKSKDPSAANPEMQQLVTEKEANPVDRQMQIHNLPEEHRVYQEHQDEDDTESLLPKNANPDEAKILIAEPGGIDDDELEDEDDEELTPLQQFLRYLKVWIRLYWATIWPILDPRTMGVAHDGPMPWWKAILLIALTVPAAALGYVVVVQGTRFVIFMAWLLEFVDDESAS